MPNYLKDVSLKETKWKDIKVGDLISDGTDPKKINEISKVVSKDPAKAEVVHTNGYHKKEVGEEVGLSGIKDEDQINVVTSYEKSVDEGLIGRFKGFRLFEAEMNDPEPSEDFDDLDDIDDSDLTSGEKAAMTRGFDILSDEQLAALYLAAKARIARREERSDNSAVRTAINMTATKSDDFADGTSQELADCMNMRSVATAQRTINKFGLLLQGKESASETLYPKIQLAYDDFKNMDEADVRALADAGIDSTAWDSALQKRREKKEEKSRAKEEKEKFVKDIGPKTIDLYDMLKTRTGKTDEEMIAAMTKAIKMVAQKHDVEPAKVKAQTLLHVKDLKDEFYRKIVSRVKLAVTESDTESEPTSDIDYSEIAWKMDKFLPDDGETQDAYYAILEDPQLSREEKIKDIATFFENFADDEVIGRYMPPRGTFEGLAAHLVDSEGKNNDE